MSTQLTDDVGEPIIQKLNKALAEISNAREDVETGKHQSAILSFLRMAQEYVRAAADDLHAVEASLASQPAEQPRGEVVDGETEYKRGYDRAVQHMADIWMDPSVRELRLVTVEARRLLKDIGERMSHGMREKWADIIAQLDKRMASSLAGLREAIAAQPKPEQAVGDGVQRVIDAALALISDAEEVETADGLMNVAQLHLWHALEDAIEKVGPADIANFTPRPAPAEVGDEWHKVGHIERSALARLMEGSKQSETLFVIGGGCQPHDVYVKFPTPRPAVATPAEVTDIISELGRMAVEGGVSMDAHDMSVMCSQLADRLTAHCQVRKDGQGVEGSDELCVAKE